MNPTGVVAAVAYLLSCLLGPFIVCAASRPNIILCMADDQGWEETGYNGHPIVRTPVLDDMARTGLRFDRFYSAAPNCGPTRGSIMTGRHPNRFGLFGPNWAMRPEETTLASLLKDIGYATGHFGKWHLGPVKAGAPNNPGASGFDEWLSHDNFFEMNPVLVRNGAPPALYHGESSQIVVDAASQFINECVVQSSPFFTVVWFGSPHGPYLALDADAAVYEPLVDQDLAHRYAEITAMDRAIGTLRKLLRDEGVAGNTLFWYCSDNGVPAASRYRAKLRGAKGNLFEGGIRVPAIIEWPDLVETPRRAHTPSVTTDILPTICDLLEIPLPDRSLDGISLRSVLDGTDMERPAPIEFWKYNSRHERQNEPWLDPEVQRGTTPTVRNPGIEFLNFQHPMARSSGFGGDAAIMNNRFKLIAPARGKPLLFDIRADPAETRDLSDDKPDIRSNLMQQLRTWQVEVEISLTGADY